MTFFRLLQLMGIMKTTKDNISFYPGKKVFLTGHTGFKGAWMTAVLYTLGAVAKGYSLEPEPGCLFNKIDGDTIIHSVIADIRDSEKLKQELCSFEPEIVIHFAAKLVKECFDDPKTAYETNVLGTVNLLEAVRFCVNVKSVLVITTDKVYDNKGDGVLYKETDPLGGIDPYSSSKICVEFICETYKKSYLQTSEKMVGLSTARASNIIGGGDHVQTRLIPSILHAFSIKKEIELRNSDQKRPWQSVLDALNGYLTISRLMHNEPKKYSSQWNIGPSSEGIRSVRDVVEQMQVFYNNNVGFIKTEQFKVSEYQSIGLDISKAIKYLDWQPKLSFDAILYNLVDFYKHQQAKEPEKDICLNQIKQYYGE